MTNDFDFQPLATEERDILSLEDFNSQGQGAPVSASVRGSRKEADAEKRRRRRQKAQQEDDAADGLEYIEADLPVQKKRSGSDGDSEALGTGGLPAQSPKKSRKRRVVKKKKDDDYVPYADAPTGDWSEFEREMETDSDKGTAPDKEDGSLKDASGDDMQYPAQDGTTIVDAYPVVEKAEYEKVDISLEEARGLIPCEALRDMCNEFTKIQGAGVSLRGALRIVKEQTEDEDLKEALDNVYEGVKMGDYLSEAMNKCKCFPFAFTIAVSAAEKNDMIAQLFGRFGTIFADEVRYRERRKVSVFYPLLTTGVALVIMLVMCLAVFPAFMDMLVASGVEETGVTAAVFSAAMMVRRIWWLLLILIILIFAGTVAYKLVRENTASGSRVKEKDVHEDSSERITVYVRFVRYMNALLKVGVATKDALFVTAHSFYDYPFVTDILLEAANAAAGGATLSNALSVSDFFPMMIMQMISVGEEMGDTPEMLDYIAGYYEEEARKKEAQERAARGPVTVIIMAVSVLLMLLMMLLPMLSLFKAVSGLN